MRIETGQRERLQTSTGDSKGKINHVSTVILMATLTLKLSLAHPRA